MLIEQDHEFLSAASPDEKYYFHISDLSVCLPKITALQLRSEICSNSLTRLVRSIGARFANSEETHH